MYMCGCCSGCMLDEQENSKLKALDDLFHIEMREWKESLKPRSQVSSNPSSDIFVLDVLCLLYCCWDVDF